MLAVIARPDGLERRCRSALPVSTHIAVYSLFVFLSAIYAVLFSESRAVRGESRIHELARWFCRAEACTRQSQGQPEPREETQARLMIIPRRWLFSAKPGATCGKREIHSPPYPQRLRIIKSVRFCGCKVVRLQNFSYLCIATTNKATQNEFSFYNPTGECSAPYLLHDCTTTQPPDLAFT